MMPLRQSGHSTLLVIPPNSQELISLFLFQAATNFWVKLVMSISH